VTTMELAGLLLVIVFFALSAGLVILFERLSS
jgi:hypothetical protein